MHEEKQQSQTDTLPAETAAAVPAVQAQAPPPAPKSLASEEIVVSAPFSYHGSAARIWRALDKGGNDGNTAATVAWYTLAVLLIAIAWVGVTCWYLIFGLLVIPYRLVRRGQRKR